MTTRSENMEALFDEIAAVFREKLKDPECPPSVLSAIVKFLQNNEITAHKQDDGGLAELEAVLPDHLWEKIK